MKRALALATVSAGMLSACAEAPQSKPDDFGHDGTGIRFQVAPLTLESLSDACYSFTVVNGATPPELVVGRGPGAVATWGASLVSGSAANSVCASRFGNAGGGDVSYVAPCDADQGVENHTVTLWVDALCDSAFAGPPLTNGSPNWAEPSPGNGSDICDEIQPYQNPCGAAGCSLPVTCVENADTPVTFNFTIMGQADQGFFDIAVNFDDVFCSAKLDDCNTLNQPIELVFDPVSKERIRTGVAAVACTVGPDGAGQDVTTQLVMSSLTVTCDDGNGGQISGTLDLATVTEEGNVAIGPFPGLVTFGTEALAGMNKVYTTVSVGLGDYVNCNFEWMVAPVEPDFIALWGLSNTWNSHGYVAFNGGGLGGDETVCHQHPLNGPGSAVTTEYVDSNNAGALASSWNAALAQGGDAFGSVSFGGDQSFSAACAVQEAEHPRYTNQARDVALCGNNYTPPTFGDACGVGWEICRLSTWQARYPAGADPEGWTSSWGADQNVRCVGGIWEANTPYDPNAGDFDPNTGQNGITWNYSVCGDMIDENGNFVNDGPYNPWNNGKYLLADDGVTILVGDGNCCEWDSGFTVPVPEDGETEAFIWGGVYCCRQ